MATEQKDFTASVDGARTAFDVGESFVPSSIRVFLNGVLQRVGVFYTETGTGISTTFAPQPGDTLQITYEDLTGEAAVLVVSGGPP